LAISAKEAKMKFSTRSSVSFALSALATISQAEESLYSRRMVKRGIDAQGNYNICKFSKQDFLKPLLI
jgi:hypothetical protein